MSDQSSGRSSADRGLGGLGLIMQLGGTVFAAFAAMLVFAGLITMGRMGGGGAGKALLYLLLIGGTAMARSLIHRTAGADLCYATTTPFAGIRRYFAASAANTGAVFLVAATEGAPAKMWIVVVCMLMAWPTALLVVTKMPGFREMDAQRIPVGPDKGFEGASLLMLAIGAIGLSIATIMLYVSYTAVTARHAPSSAVLLLVAAVVLFIRAILHVAAGLRGVRETYVDRVVEGANRYANFGVIASFVVGGSILLLGMQAVADPTVLVMVGCVTWVLLAWPLAIRRFFSERQFADMMAGVDPSAHVRASDMGLSSLGWLLFAQGVLGLAMVLPSILMGDGGLFGGSGGGGMSRMGGLGEAGSLMSILQAPAGHSPWWSVGTAAVTLWAAIELIRMTELYRVAGTVFGAVVTAVTLYMFWPIISHLGEVMRAGPMAMVSLLAGLAIQLAIPLTVLFAANRNPLPAATARIAPPGPPSPY